MSLFSSRNSEKQHEDELQRNEKERKKIIRKGALKDVADAKRAVKSRLRHGKPTNVGEVVPILHWKKDSVMWVMNYTKLKDKKGAIASDVDYFFEVVEGLRLKWPGWNLMVIPSLVNEGKPDKIVVQKR